jgi:hypothetical protein
MITRYDLTRTRRATFSADERYRYELRYSLHGFTCEAPANPVCFMMLNPSTANEFKPDPTVTRCMGFARLWGHSDLYVYNLFGWRSRDPDELLSANDPIGPENDLVLRSIPPQWPIICAWGSHKAVKARLPRVLELLAGRELLCLRMTKSGSCEHPLYLPASLRPQPWKVA